MKCDIPNPDDLITNKCGRPAEWILQVSTLGYPSNTLQVQKAIHVCGVHMLSEVAVVAADYKRLFAGVQIMRIETASAFIETNKNYGRSLGW